jgi:hypothetical protein
MEQTEFSAGASGRSREQAEPGLTELAPAVWCDRSGSLGWRAALACRIRSRGWLRFAGVRWAAM